MDSVAAQQALMTTTSMSGATVPSTTDNSQQAIARSAVGRGVRHSFGFDTTGEDIVPSGPASSLVDTTNFLIPVGVEDSLSQLTNNYQNSLLADTPFPDRTGSQQLFESSTYNPNDPFPALLSRNSSLIDLAMIPSVEDGDDTNGDSMPTVPGMNFVDFPQPEVDPSKQRPPGETDTTGG
jgi:hypothetical protein